MKQLFASLSAATLVVGLAGATHAPQAIASKATPSAKRTPNKAELRAQQLKKSAPGDEYFGRMKMSYLGINNTLRDDAVRAGDYTIDTGIINSVSFAEDALNDWRRKYPDDPQLARTFYLMGRMYGKIWTAAGQGRAAYYYQMLESRFPKTYFGKLMHAQLAKGFTEHVLADALPCPTPLPTATPTPTPMPRGFHPTATPAPTPSPTPSPTPTPIPTPPPGGHIHLVIVPQPCYVVTPSPSPTPVPTATPTPTPGPVIAPPASGSPVPLPSGALAPVATATPPEPIRTMIPRPSPTASHRP